MYVCCLRWRINVFIHISYLRLFNFVKTQSNTINKVSGVNSKTIDMITIVEKQIVQLSSLCYPTTVLNERLWHFRVSKHTLIPPTYFRGSDPNDPRIYAPSCSHPARLGTSPEGGLTVICLHGAKINPFIQMSCSFIPGKIKSRVLGLFMF